MPTWFAQQSNVNINAANVWNSAPNGSGSWLDWADLAANDVLVANGRTSIRINVDLTCQEITNAANGGTIAGGFLVDAGRTVIANFTAASHGNLLTYGAGAGDVFLIGNMTSLAGGSGVVWYSNTNSRVWITGNLTTAGNGACFGTENRLIATIIGNLTLNAGATGMVVFDNTSASGVSLVIVGNIVSNSGQAVRIYGNGPVTLTGDIIANASFPAVVYGAGSITHTGRLLSNSNGTRALESASSNTNAKYFVQPTGTIEHRYAVTGGTTRSLYTGGVNLGQPIPADVRFGTEYGAANEYTGALRVPEPQYVNAGVLTDDTVGTLEVDLQPIITAIENIDLQPILDRLPATGRALAEEDYTAPDNEAIDAINNRLPANPAAVSDVQTTIDFSPTINPTPVTVNPTPVTVNPTPVTVNPTVAVSIPAIEAASIVLDQEVTKYRGTAWAFIISGLVSVPSRSYWTVKRSTEADSKAVLQVLKNSPSDAADGLKIVNGSIENITASGGSISYEEYTEAGATRYRATLLLLPEWSARILPDLYRLDLKDVSSNTDQVLAECVLRVKNPVTLATS